MYRSTVCKTEQIDWNAIASDFEYVGEAQFCYVSVFGFTSEARRVTQEKGVFLLHAEDFASSAEWKASRVF